MTELILIFIARWLIYLLIVLVGLIGIIKWGNLPTLKILFTVSVSFATAEVLKYVFNIARPDAVTPLFVFDPAFPSGHTAAVATLGALVFRRNKLLGFLLFILSLIIGWARVLLGVHYPIDIVGGFILGVFLGVVFSKWLKV